MTYSPWQPGSAFPNDMAGGDNPLDLYIDFIVLLIYMINSIYLWLHREQEM